MLLDSSMLRNKIIVRSFHCHMHNNNSILVVAVAVVAVVSAAQFISLPMVFCWRIHLSYVASTYYTIIFNRRMQTAKAIATRAFQWFHKWRRHASASKLTQFECASIFFRRIVRFTSIHLYFVFIFFVKLRCISWAFTHKFINRLQCLSLLLFFVIFRSFAINQRNTN